VVGSDVVVLVGGDRDAPLVAKLLEAVTAEDPVEAIVGVLSGEGMRRLPSFCCAIREPDAVRLLVRGSFMAVVVTRDGSEYQIEGPAVTTWAEQVVFHPRMVTLGSPSRHDTQVVMAFPGSGLHFAQGLSETDQYERLLSAGDGTGAMPAKPLGGAGPGGWIDATEAKVESRSPLSAGDDSTGGDSRGAPEATFPASGHPVPPGRPLSQSGGDSTFDFAHLLEETHYRNVEAAAVRGGAGDEDREAAHPDAQESRFPPVLDPSLDPPVPDDHLAETWSSTWAAPQSLAFPPADPAPKSAAAPGRIEGLIDEVPGAAESRTLRPSAPPVSPSWPAAEPASRSWSPPARPVSPPIADEADDADDATVAIADLRSMSAARSAGVQVQAVSCPIGHPNPPHADRCRTCGTVILDRSVRQLTRPSLGLIHFEDGMVVELDRPLLLGREPNAEPKVNLGSDPPGLITIPDPAKGLSRVHIEIRLQDWHVVVVDRESLNHTFVELPGRPSQQLRPGEECVITPGTRVNLGEITSFTYRLPPS